jgi:hypothetical protein
LDRQSVAGQAGTEIRPAGSKISAQAGGVLCATTGEAHPTVLQRAPPWLMMDKLTVPGIPVDARDLQDRQGVLK